MKKLGYQTPTVDKTCSTPPYYIMLTNIRVVTLGVLYSTNDTAVFTDLSNQKRGARSKRRGALRESDAGERALGPGAVALPAPPTVPPLPRALSPVLAC